MNIKSTKNAESKKFSKDVAAFQSKMVTSQRWQSCLNCLYFEQHDEFTDKPGELVTKTKCTIFNMPPPLNIVIVGCEEHENDIPF